MNRVLSIAGQALLHFLSPQPVRWPRCCPERWHRPSQRCCLAPAELLAEFPVGSPAEPPAKLTAVPALAVGRPDLQIGSVQNRRSSPRCSIFWMSVLFNPSAASALFSSCNWCWMFADVVAGALAAALAAAAFAAVALRGAAKFAAVSAAFTGFACGSGVCANRNSAAGENSVIWLTVNNPAACAAFGAEGVNWSSVAAKAPLFALVRFGAAA